MPLVKQKKLVLFWNIEKLRFFCVGSSTKTISAFQEHLRGIFSRWPCLQSETNVLLYNAHFTLVL